MDPYSPPVTAELVGFYRAKIEAFEGERSDYLKRLDDIELRHADMHRMSWELHQKSLEVQELQQQLSDWNVQRMEDKQLISNLYAELDSFKIQEMEDRKNIEDLLALTQPVSEEVCFVRDKRAQVYSTRVLPTEPRAPPENTMSLRGNLSPQASAAARTGLVVASPLGPIAGGAVQAPAVHGGTTSIVVPRPTAVLTPAGPGVLPGGRREPRSSRVLRTVYLPTAKTDSLLLTIEALREQLEDKTRQLEEQKAVMLEDRRVCKEQEAVRAKQDADRLSALERRAQELDEKLLRCTREHLAWRHSAQVRERELMETLESTKAANDKMRVDLDAASHRVELEKSFTQSRIEEGTAAYTDHYRRQLADLTADVTELRNRNKDLQARNVALRDSLKKLEERRQLEMEGYGTDIGMLKRNLKALEGRLPRPCAPHSRSARRSAAGLPPFDEPGRDSEVERSLETMKDRVFLLETSFGRTRERLG